VIDNYFSFSNLEDIDWKNIRMKYPKGFKNYMAYDSLEDFMIAFNCCIKVVEYLNTSPDFTYWETRVDCMNRAISVIGLNTFGEAKIKSIEYLFELVENQLENDRFTNN
jgi:hypothetical protein|tara:strand:+ start:278 stop:604 length:327 start_codon:yes stop_codon:yes gene_type:complete